MRSNAVLVWLSVALFYATVPPALTIPTGSRRAVSVGFSVGCASEVPAVGVFVCRLGSPGN